jgi:ABC-2 type transport system ATP-binding protein
MGKRAPARSRKKPNVIETHGLTKRFGPVVAVRDLDLDVRQGEVFGYLGPNGAGKSTTIRMLLDFIRPTQGTYELLGGSGADPDVRRRIGYLPGELRFDMKYTANDVIEFYGKLRGGAPKAQQLLERFDLDPKRPIGQLSSGNRRKVGIVQAFMHAPELLLLDEPTSGLDPLLQEEFNNLIRETVSEGATILLSSHFLHEVEELADRVGILRRGELIATAAVETLRRRARQPIDIYFKQKVDPKVFLKIPEVKEATFANGIMRLILGGSVEGVLRTAARLHAYRIVSIQADLEEVFLDLYGKNEDSS